MKPIMLRGDWRREAVLDSFSRSAARIIVESGAVSFGLYKLSSGGTSRVYVDMRVIPGNPRLFKRLLSLAASLAYSIGLDREVDVVVGVATGGLSWATGLALQLDKPLAYVRPDVKIHGKGRVVEGSVSGLRALVVDDVATTGSSLERAVSVLRRDGSRPVAVLVLLDRLQGARKRLKKKVDGFYSLSTIIHVLEEAQRTGIASEGDLEAVRRELVGV